jgi:PadR family transcriptional regulator, regulatory protein AphA
MNVKTLCLGFLSLREASGYEIKKDVEEGLFSHFIEASYGSIYPALNQLSLEGLVTVREQEQTGKPDKKIYAITETGRQALSKGLCVLPAKDKYKSEFLFQMLLGELISPEIVLLAIDKQLTDLHEDLASIAECRCEEPQSMGCAFVADYGEAVLTASVTCLEQKRSEVVRQMAARAAE